MAEFVGAFPSSLALDDRNNIVREAEAYVYDVNDANLASPLPITDLQGSRSPAASSSHRMGSSRSSGPQPVCSRYTSSPASVSLTSPM